MKGKFIVRDNNPDIFGNAIEVQPIARSSQLNGGIVDNSTLVAAETSQLRGSSGDGSTLVSAETKELRGGSGDGSWDGSRCVPGDICEYNRSCLIRSKQILCNSRYPDIKGTFIVRDNNPIIPATASEVPPTRRL